jgi:hypothetical protein
MRIHIIQKKIARLGILHISNNYTTLVLDEDFFFNLLHCMAYHLVKSNGETPSSRKYFIAREYLYRKYRLVCLKILNLCNLFITILIEMSI